MRLKTKFVLFGFLALLGLSVIFSYQYSRFNDGRLHVVFCNVGQGDGIFIRIPSGTDILIDGGPDNSVLSCLQNHMPFWDKQIELMILSHPHADHLNGLISVLEGYNVLYFATEKLNNNTEGFKELNKSIRSEKAKMKYVFNGDNIKFKDVSLKILAPNKEYLERTSPGGNINETGEFSSLISLLSFGSFDLLLTGDSQIAELEEVMKSVNLPFTEVMQVPHHGSKTGLNSNLIYQIRPGIAIVSVGKKNRYGHPSKEILKILEEQKIKTLRTDQSGNIEIVSDGKKWWIR